MTTDDATPRRGGWKLVAPLLLVTTFAIYGQVVTGLENYTAAAAPELVRWGVAIGAAAAIESIALFVQWHAHDALLLKASATAARLRRASYLIAAAVATINYWHFSDGWKPTAAAVVFAVFSASGPWLWGLHTRRVQHLQLLREGQVDSSGATFSAERWRAFPIRTFLARRWSIDYCVDNPLEAWAGYKIDATARAARLAPERGARRQLLASARRATDAPPPAANDVDDTLVAPAASDGELPDRRPFVNANRMHELIADLRAIARDNGRRYVRDEIKQMYGVGSDKASIAMKMLGWGLHAVEQASQATAGGR